MKLKVEERTTGRKGVTSQLRREGMVPAILYGAGKAGTPVAVKNDTLKEILRKIQPGRLSTTIFELERGAKTIQAIIKDVQYHVASYEIEHVDFLEMEESKLVEINVPISLVGAADCAGVKLGGFIRQVIRSLKVSCLPKNIPESFSLDIRNVGIGQSKLLSDLEIPPSVRPLAKLTEVLVLVGKKAGA
ncbi:MAG: 50S ribosomal protein L25 [uncultured bacterium]|nr:MAG: 50S ribosomal protein L25 [uncultured bacterium]OGN56533.1 MAG: hypothetical protein A2796_07130 [Chlamydiae bacterium RIFCSPHIGHO2_01_FULL_44_39]OGN61037.1 MAG: hypothetical protein A3D96_02780 [Chlamydiae bacterium RIFCSPHIGHO2_12_FULL_44_59]OGN66813.1 MAG: hypothetical protein A2978_00265 [Chlamydiae bacterium RIFCSPLOWO2_01_FULL_44_52]OGN70011.1 MAG: hypothetical protein A3I67_01580 [Chlamydiae bacterium RIFCSPLOWO2_02_FULL_45_22]OGN71084.1 MAG: hypothetical protein A3F79_05655 [Ch